MKYDKKELEEKAKEVFKNEETELTKDEVLETNVCDYINNHWQDIVIELSREDSIKLKTKENFYHTLTKNDLFSVNKFNLENEFYEELEMLIDERM